MSNGYRPENDVTPELDANNAAYHQSLIGVLQWMVELGRVDIYCEVLMMLSCLALPREGHLQQLFHMITHLEKHHNTEIVFDPTPPDIDQHMSQKQDWLNTVYALGKDRLKEDVPTNLPKPQGKGRGLR